MAASSVPSCSTSDARYMEFYHFPLKFGGRYTLALYILGLPYYGKHCQVLGGAQCMQSMYRHVGSPSLMKYMYMYMYSSNSVVSAQISEQMVHHEEKSTSFPPFDLHH